VNLNDDKGETDGRRLRVVASIEARMGSSRLPGKVMADIAGRPAISRLITRLRRCRHLDAIVLATTTEAQDDVLQVIAESEGIQCFRGSENDVLDRVVAAHEMLHSDIIVEITGDCPLLDPELIDMGIVTFLENECDVVTNVRKASYPMGLDFQVYSFDALRQVSRTTNDPAVREHVSLYFYENPTLYRIVHLLAPQRWWGPNYRFQLDYPEDLKFIREIYSRLGPTWGDTFGVEEIMAVLRSEPALVEINLDCEEKSTR
jgi:spore coat polysaccharide biosynthesis protein SpsF